MNFDPFFAWVEQSGFSVWLRESPSLLAFPSVLVFHTIGMGFLAGTNLGMDLRILGIAKRIPLLSFEKFFPVMWYAFWLNLVSGFVLLIAYPTKALTNPVFYLKLTLIGLALCDTRWLRNRVLRAVDEGSISRNARVMAGISLVLWLGAITAGRLLAYTYSRLQWDTPIR